MELSFKQKYSFGVGALGKDLCYSIVSYYLMIYFTDLVGLTPAFVGNLFLVARLWDAVNDPMMGMIVDNTRTRWEKFRPWILIGTAINAVVLMFLFKNPNSLSQSSIYVYYSIMYLLWGMTYTIMDIPYWSMLPSLSRTNEERAQMSVIPRIFASCAWLIMGTFGLAFIDKLGNDNKGKGYEYLAMVVAIVFIITAIITVVNVKDRSGEIVESNKKHEKTTIKKAFRVIKQNDQLAIFIGVVLAYNLVAQLSGGIFVPQNAPIIALSGILIKLGSGFTLGATTVMLADVIYYGEVKFGSRNESVIASFQTLLVKVASAVAGWLIGVGLTIVGYMPNVTQTAGTILGMRILMVVVPSVITILGFIIYAKGYKLQGEYQEKIMEELNNKRKYEELNAEIDKDIITT